ncbi:MAG: carbohydrate-binding domain-containing protein, partial [Clostridium sp.]
GGNIKIDSSDDSIHTNDTLVINGGNLELISGDDGMHADSSLDINDGNINISKSYEGVESQVININGGTIYVTSTDDGINAGGGSDGSSVNGRPGENSFNTSSTCSLNINGGYIYVDAAGDGLDANGSIYMTDGFVIVNGPTNSGNGALDYDNIFEISGGTLISAGSSGMLQAPSESSTQNSLKIVMNTLDADTVVRIEDENGNELMTFAPAKSFGSLVVSSPEITFGTSFKVYTGGTCNGDSRDGIFENSTYENGKEIGSGTVEGSVTSINEEGVSAGGMGGPGRGGNGGMKGQGEREKFMNMNSGN